MSQNFKSIPLAFQKLRHFLYGEWGGDDLSPPPSAPVRVKFRKQEALKKELSEELMPVAWHLNRWSDWCMSEDEKKEIDPMFIEEL